MTDNTAEGIDHDQKSQSSVIDVYALARTSVNESINRLENLISRVSTEQILSATAFLETSLPADYRESEHEGKLYALEYVCAFALKRPVSLKVGDQLSLQEFIDCSRSIRQQGLFSPLLSDEVKDDETDDEKLFRLVKAKVLLHSTIIRCPNYREHEKELAMPLLGDSRLPELAKKFGFSVDCCFIFFEKLKSAIDRGLNSLQPYTSLVYGAIVSLLGAENEASNPNEQEVPESLIQQFLNEAPSQLYILSVDEIIQETGLSKSIVEAILKTFQSHFGEIPVSYTRLSPVLSLQRRPFIEIEPGRWFIGMLDLFPAAIRPRVEELLKTNPTAPLWTRYQKIRADYLVKKTIEALKLAAPNASYYCNLKYDNPDRSGEETELDVLAVIDKTVLVVECKAGGFGDAARRAAKLSLAKDINGLIGEASEQAGRAIRYLKSSQNPAFVTPKGKVVIQMADVADTIPVVVTLDSLDAVTSQLAMLRRVKLLDNNYVDLPWALALSDLQIICDVTEWSSQLIHYLRRRIPKYALERLHYTEELDLFSLYLKNGLFFPAEPMSTDKSLLHIANMTEDFDSYYMQKMTSKRQKVKKPCMELPASLRNLMRQVEESNSLGYSLVNQYLLDLAPEAREEVNDAINKLVKLAINDGRSHDFSSEVVDRAGFTIFVEPNQTEVHARFNALEQWCALKKYKSKAPLWIGVCLYVQNSSFELAGLNCLPFEWYENEELERACSLFEERSGKKIRTVTPQDII